MKAICYLSAKYLKLTVLNDNFNIILNNFLPSNISFTFAFASKILSK